MVYWIFSFLLGAFSPSIQDFIPGPEVAGDSLSVQVLNYDQLKPLLQSNSDTTYVVNFWATWCGPCVQELPYFLELDALNRDKPFRLILVSLDFKKDYLRKLEPFVRERKIEKHVIVLEDSRSNYWIDDIDKSWSGAIPATLIYRADRRSFFERTFHHTEELNDIVKPFLNY